MFGFNVIPSTSHHQYSLAATGIKFKSRIYNSREIAKDDMYKFMNKHGLHIINEYDDKHYKTYICNDGVRFYINRM